MKFNYPPWLKRRPLYLQPLLIMLVMPNRTGPSTALASFASAHSMSPQLNSRPEDCDFSSCDPRVPHVFSSGDADAICRIEDLSCLSGCGDLVESIQVHCTCETGLALTFDKNYTFFGRPYCCGGVECQASVAAYFSPWIGEDELRASCSLYSCAPESTDIDGATTRLISAGASAPLSSAPTPLPSAAPTPLPSVSPSALPSALPSGLPTPVPSSPACDTSACGPDVLGAFNTGNSSAMCTIDDLGCLSACGDLVETIQVHCACGTGFALTFDKNYTFCGERYCCGSVACQAAVVAFYSPSMTESELNAPCGSYSCANKKDAQAYENSTSPSMSPTLLPSAVPTPLPSAAPSGLPSSSPSLSSELYHQRVRLFSNVPKARSVSFILLRFLPRQNLSCPPQVAPSCR